ncbi:uncharacterized protein [Dysidea avara]|uniref:uncharacterized protein isoform X1 n=1 Tax=Dysidea avara TaxID=196820 RepID=UPI00331D9E0D
MELPQCLKSLMVHRHHLLDDFILVNVSRSMLVLDNLVSRMKRSVHLWTMATRVSLIHLWTPQHFKDGPHLNFILWMRNLTEFLHGWRNLATTGTCCMQPLLKFKTLLVKLEVT